MFKAKLVDAAAEDQLLRHIPENQLVTFTSPTESFAYLFLQVKRDTAPGPRRPTVCGLVPCRPSALDCSRSPRPSDIRRCTAAATRPDRSHALHPEGPQRAELRDETRPITLLINVIHKFVAIL